MSFRFALPAGTQVKLLTAGKYCDRDILVTGKGHTDADLQKKFDEGLEHGAATCAAKHYVYNFKGNGTGSISFHVPFEPDAIQVIGFDPLGYKGVDTANLIIADLRAFGTVAGFCAYGTSTGVTTAIYSTTSVFNRYSQTEDGIVAITNLSSSRSIIFDSRFIYTVIAVKYAEQTDKERITDFVNGLTGSGSVTLNQAKVTAAFTDEEWAALIATRPEQTFNWI